LARPDRSTTFDPCTDTKITAGFGLKAAELNLTLLTAPRSMRFVAL
jgi:hypothetical protein